MGLEHKALVKTDDLPIRHEGEVHNGKVRSVYWLSGEDSARLIKDRKYDVHSDASLGVMVTSDRITAFDVQWKGEDGLDGVPGKGAALNAVSAHWFKRFKESGLSGNHIVDVAHPLVWIVQRAEPIKVEAIARDYMAGSMWRDYQNGVRDFCGHELPEGLKNHQKLANLLITPTTKGVLRGVPGVPEQEDANVSREQLKTHYKAFGFDSAGDVAEYERLLREGFRVISKDLGRLGKIFADTKFELGYVRHPVGGRKMIYIDEVGTPDSSRIWDGDGYRATPQVVSEESKEEFRQFLLATHDNNVLLNKMCMDERRALAEGYRVPVNVMMGVSRTYARIAERITGEVLPHMDNPRAEIIEALERRKLVV